MTLPAFPAGQAAYRAGLSIENNPHPNSDVTGDKYPGAYRNWRAGWANAKATAEHDARLKEGN